MIDIFHISTPINALSIKLIIWPQIKKIKLPIICYISQVLLEFSF